MTVSEREEKILEFWDKNAIFEKSVQERPESRPYVFYDGPPFATGLPHYGNLVASLMKDVVPRYQTMRGYRVERVWGWDCHGLPIENIIEEKLQLKTKKDIEAYGVGRFNEECRATVLQYAQEWKKIIRRIGRWVDMDHAYMTMDRFYMESVWWVFRQLWDKGLIYEGKKAMHVCPRCVTPLSNFEVTLAYKDVKDISATVAFELKNPEKIGLKNHVAILAWTTTPWTLPGNVLLAVGADIDYVAQELLDKESGESKTVILARDRWGGYAEKIKDIYEFGTHTLVKGRDLTGLMYIPLFPYFQDTQNAFRIVVADFVTTQDGTGVVHIAPAFGEDDYQLGVREDVGFVQHVTMTGEFIPEVVDFAGREVKPKDDPLAADIEVIKVLAQQKKLFLKESYLHSYPHCWRCDTPLLNYATSSWFVRVTRIKDELLKTNAETRWIPENVRDGRFGKWLENARDWALSRNRYWGTPLPVWRSEDGDTLCIGGGDELEQLSGQKVVDLHKHSVDEIVIHKDGKEYRRIPEVLDCWFESGSMPYGQVHYPFENKEKFEAGFPAEFIAEGQDQTRGWFYTLHVLATALTMRPTPSIPTPDSTPAFKNVIVNGMVLAEDGKKMSKHLKNFPDPRKILEEYGADALRSYLVSSPVMHAESLNFSEAGVREMYNKMINTLSNVQSFYELFAEKGVLESISDHPLDRWILSRLHTLIGDVTKNLESYQLAQAARPLLDFISDLSQWYVRRSRDRLKSEDIQERMAASGTLASVLLDFSKVIAPFTPFIAEEIYQTLRTHAGNGLKESVHLDAWPIRNSKKVDPALEEQMMHVRAIVEAGHALRAESGLKVRQPLSAFSCSLTVTAELAHIIADELNVKEVVPFADEQQGDEWKIKEDVKFSVALNTHITDELRNEGTFRDIVRQINALRKEQGLTPRDIVGIAYATGDERLERVIEAAKGELARAVIARSIEKKEIKDMSTMTVDTRELKIGIII